MKSKNTWYKFSHLAPPRPTEKVDPCNPSPCGSNALCNHQNIAAACQCIPEYFGDPYFACRPECISSTDCPPNKACKQLKCIDPCPGTCGVNARSDYFLFYPSTTIFQIIGVKFLNTFQHANACQDLLVIPLLHAGKFLEVSFEHISGMNAWLNL